VGNCQDLKSRGWGIYYILAKKIQIPGVLPGGGVVTAGIDPCIKPTTQSKSGMEFYYTEMFTLTKPAQQLLNYQRHQHRKKQNNYYTNFVSRLNSH
jgi:hypothetical protein